MKVVACTRVVKQTTSSFRLVSYIEHIMQALSTRNGTLSKQRHQSEYMVHVEIYVMALYRPLQNTGTHLLSTLDKTVLDRRLTTGLRQSQNYLDLLVCFNFVVKRRSRNVLSSVLMNVSPCAFARSKEFLRQIRKVNFNRVINLFK